MHTSNLLQWCLLVHCTHFVALLDFPDYIGLNGTNSDHIESKFVRFVTEENINFIPIPFVVISYGKNTFWASVRHLINAEVAGIWYYHYVYIASQVSAHPDGLNNT